MAHWHVHIMVHLHVHNDMLTCTCNGTFTCTHNGTFTCMQAAGHAQNLGSGIPSWEVLLLPPITSNHWCSVSYTVISSLWWFCHRFDTLYLLNYWGKNTVWFLQHLLDSGKMSDIYKCNIDPFLRVLISYEPLLVNWLSWTTPVKQ